MDSYVAHSSVVKAFSASDNLIFSGGGREALNCWRIERSHQEADFESRHPRLILCASCSSFKAEQDSRIMSLASSVVKSKFDEALVYAACSDGILRVCHFLGPNQFRPTPTVISPDFGCLLAVRAIDIDSESFLVLAAGTTGRIGVWRLDVLDLSTGNLRATSVLNIPVHQSGVNCMEILGFSAFKSGLWPLLAVLDWANLASTQTTC